MADQQDPSKMSDEELEKALEEGGTPEPDNKPEPKKEEPETPKKDEEEPEKKPEEEPTPEPKKEEEPEPEKEPSRREQLRVQQLLKKMAEGEKPVEKPASPTGIDYEKDLEADPALVKRLTEDREKSNQAMFDKGLEQANSIRFLTRLEVDAPRVETKYPFLDKNDKEFDPAAADAINQKYLQFVGWDAKTQGVKHPDIRYADFVEAEVEFAQQLAKNMVAETQKNVTKQTAQTGLRPDGGSAKRLNLNKPPEQMSDDELDAVIAQAVPAQ